MHNPTEKRLRIIRAIVSARKRAGLTQVEASTRLGMSPNFMAKVESGKRDVRAWELYDIAAALGTDPHDLLGPPRRARRAKA